MPDEDERRDEVMEGRSPQSDPRSSERWAEGAPPTARQSFGTAAERGASGAGGAEADVNADARPAQGMPTYASTVEDGLACRSEWRDDQHSDGPDGLEPPAVDDTEQRR